MRTAIRKCRGDLLRRILLVGVYVLASAGVAGAAAGSGQGERAEEPPVSAEATWERAAERSRDDLEWAVYVEREPTPGRPAFRIETTFDVSPEVASRVLMESMTEEDETTRGERRQLLERAPGTALVHTFIDLPFLFADRELAVRIVASHDEATGVHRIDWRDANQYLPPPSEGVLRLETVGYWEFRPVAVSDAPGRGIEAATQAIYMSRAEVGGTLPAALRDRLMQGQAEDAVQRLARLIDEWSLPDTEAVRLED